jgi:hypothetical protein
LLSVFERKWQGLPRFQQTRGILRLLALWVSKAYREDHQKAYKDPLISLGLGTIVEKRSVPIVRDPGDLDFSADVGPMLGTSLSAQESPK